MHDVIYACQYRERAVKLRYAHDEVTDVNTLFSVSSPSQAVNYIPIKQFRLKCMYNFFISIFSLFQSVNFEFISF